jgi:hypothetical protein
MMMEIGVFCKKMVTTLVFDKAPLFSAEKLAKIAENCDHNIDPWSPCSKSSLESFFVVPDYFHTCFSRRNNDCPLKKVFCWLASRINLFLNIGLGRH